MHNRFLFLTVFACATTLFADDIKTFAGPKDLSQDAASQSTAPALPAEDGDDKVLLSDTKALILVGNPDLVEKGKRFGLTSHGVVFKGLDVPGGDKKLAKKLELLFLHKPLTKKKINELKHEIVMHYRQHHHPVMMVFVPEQDASDGTFQLVVIESRVGQVCIKGNHFTSTERIRDSIRLKPGDRIDDSRLLQDVGWINRNPYRRANVLFSPGSERGTTDVQVRVEDRRPWRLYAGGDNTGSPHTGQTRWFTGGNFENALFPEHLLSFQFTSANRFSKFNSYTGQYVILLPWRNIMNVFAGLAFVKPDLPGATSHGKSYQVTARYDVPVWPLYPNHQLEFTLGYDFKGSNNNITFGLDNLPSAEGSQSKTANISQFVFGAHFGLDKWRQMISSDLEIFYSPCAMISNQSEAAFKSLNPHASPKYIYGRLNYTHQVALPKRWIFKVQGRLQLSDNSLLASEQFALGGYSSVRGYFERVVNGDNAYCINVEVQTPSFRIVPQIAQNPCFFYAFFDYGHAWDHKKIPGLPFSQTLMGIGPGMRYYISSYFSMRLEVGFPLRSIQTEKIGLARAHMSAVLSY